MGRWTQARVLELAPDAASRQAARALARPGTWSELGSTPTLVWGRCQGSGAAPYQVTVDLAEPAFRCSCPSRKHPCKHGLALLLLWVAGDGSVAEVERAAGFAEAWAGERAERRSARRRSEPADPEAQARRRTEREALMSSGMDELERWLEDLVRDGLAGARSRPYRWWDATAARLVDAQLPGLADRVRAAGLAVRDGADWAGDLLAELGRWYLAARGWRNRHALPAAAAADLRAYVGWPDRTEDVLAGERVRDEWVVVGRRLGGDERVRSQRTWLRGRTTGQVARHLDFAAGGAAFRVASVVGTVVAGEVALYPGWAPRRVAFAGDERPVGASAELGPATSVADGLAQVAHGVAANPFVDHLSLCLAHVTPVVERGDGGLDGDTGWLVDGAGDALALAPGTDLVALLADTAGQPTTVFGEWCEGTFAPTTLAVDGTLVAR